MGLRSTNDDGQYEYTINYDDGIISGHAIASRPVPINYDYGKNSNRSISLSLILIFAYRE
jgi:hypothetical protein